MRMPFQNQPLDRQLWLVIVLTSGSAVGALALGVCLYEAFIFESSERLIQHLRGYALVFGLVISALALASIVVGALLRRHVSLPIQALARAARTVTNTHDYAIRLPPRAGGDEIRDVSVAFNEMLQQIQQRDTELRHNHDELEQRVCDRTAQLTAAEARFRRLVESAPDGIVIVNEAGEIQLANRQAEALFGYTTTELQGQSVDLLLPERFRNRHRGHRADYNAAPRPRPMGVGLELFGRRKDGTEFPVEISLSPITNHAAEVMAIVRDTSTRKRAEAEINALHRAVAERASQLESANRELEAFTYSVSHDLRAPLRAIDGFSRLLLDHHAAALPAEGQRYLGIVRDNTLQMGQLIDDLLAFSRLGRTALTKQEVNVTEIVHDCLRDLAADREGRHVSIEVASLPPAHADPALLRQVIINLLSNALKFTRQREQAVIEIGSHQLGNETVYFVHDNGVGFDMQYADKLFGVFQRLHRAEDFPGTGVGLAIVQRIIYRHGGRIWTDAVPDKGATFFFTLAPPAASSEAAA